MSSSCTLAAARSLLHLGPAPLMPSPLDFGVRVSGRLVAALAPLAFLLGAVSALPAQGPLNGASERFAVLQPARTKTFIKSGADPDDRLSAPAMGNDDGFTGINGTESYRELVNGQDVAVLADIQGREGFLGVFFRNFWSGVIGGTIAPIEDNRAQILVDSVVLHDHLFSEYFRNENDPRGQVRPFVGPWTSARSGGFLTHTPIAFERSLKLRVFENPFQNAGRFHKIAWTTADPEGNLAIPDLTAWDTVLARRGGWRHSIPRAATSVSNHRLDIAPGGAGRVLVSGPGAILEFRVQVDDFASWEHLVARIRFDGRSDVGVDVPLRMLGFTSEPPYTSAIDSVLCGNDGANTLWCYFPMPFAESARIEIVNPSGVERGLNLTLATWRGSYPQPYGYFTATWQRAVTQPGVPFRGPRLTNCRGVLRALVLEDWVDTTGRIPPITDMTHLEGDLCVRTNGLRGDDHTFDASETSIGKWGWYLTPSDLPFQMDGSFNTSVHVSFHIPGAVAVHRMMGSTLVFDPVQFVDGIDVMLEHGVQNLAQADYGFMAILYVQPGAARRTVGELDVGEPAAESAWNAQFGTAPLHQVTSTFFRDQFYGDAPLSDEVRHVVDWYRFTVASPNLANNRGLCLGLRLDRLRVGSGGVCQARVYVDGYFAGLMHSFTTNPLEVWKEGGETEIELPRALTDGKASFVVELRPVTGSQPLRIGNVRVYAYDRD